VPADRPMAGEGLGQRGSANQVQVPPSGFDPAKFQRMHRLIVVTASAIALTISMGTIMLAVWARPARPSDTTVSVSPLPLPQPTSPPPVAFTPAISAPPEAQVIQPTPVPPAKPPEATAPAAPAASRVQPSPPAPANEESIPPGTNDVAAVLEVLNRYRLAVSSLNPGAVRAVWPGANVGALAREFAEVKRQTLAFDNCQIDVEGIRAQAVCTGRANVVSKADAQPNIQRRRWTFTLTQEREAWKVRTVTAE
jgi:hypothetical protein